MNVIKKVLIAAVILAVVTLIGCFISLKVCHINPSIEYEWYSGIWQGLFIVPNWVMSQVYDKSILYIAPHHTSGYTFYWWLMLVFHTFIAFCAYGPGTSTKKARKKDSANGKY